jgi:hypothetical protein
MVWVPFATAIEFHVKLFDDDDAIRLPSTRKATRLTLRLILTVVVTKLATVESGVGEAIFIGLAAYARLCPKSKRIRATIPTLVSLNRLPPVRLAISPPRPHHNPSWRETWYQAKKIVRRLHSRAYRYLRIRPNPARDLGLRPAHPCATSPRRSVQRRSSAHPITTASCRVEL